MIRGVPRLPQHFDEKGVATRHTYVHTERSSVTPLVSLPRITLAAFGALAVITLAAVSYEAAARLAPMRWGVGYAAAGAGAVLALFACWTAPRLSPRLLRIGGRLATLSPGRALAIILVVGLVARLACTAIMGPVITSDGSVYVKLASRLLEGRPYVDPRGELAYWPPGYPLLLAAAGLPFGLAKPEVAVVVVNLFFYIVATIGAWLVGRWLFGPGPALVAAAILAAWPNLVLGASGAAKEFPALGLLTAAVALYIWAQRRSAAGANATGLFAALGCGLALGVASLVQPALMFLAIAVMLAEILHWESWRSAAARLLLVIIGMSCAIAPWSVRNAHVLGATVPISTNGGDVLYRANNPQAVPGYLAAGPVDLRQYPEVERSRLGTRLALRWIAEEPHRFLVLSWQRLLHFSGDNSTSAYDALRRGTDDLKSRYVALKAVSNAAWLSLWLLILVALVSGSLRSAAAPGAWLLVLSYLYLAAMDSIAESGARHHVPFAGVLAVLAASAFASRSNVREDSLAVGSRHPAVQFVDFTAVGAVSTAVHFVTLILLVQSADWPPALATSAGFLVGALTSYVLNYHLTFSSHARHAAAAPRFLVIAALSMLLNLAIFSVLVHGLSAHYLLGQAVATAVVLIVNFVANRALTFVDPDPAYPAVRS